MQVSAERERETHRVGLLLCRPRRCRIFHSHCHGKNFSLTSLPQLITALPPTHWLCLLANPVIASIARYSHQEEMAPAWCRRVWKHLAGCEHTLFHMTPAPHSCVVKAACHRNTASGQSVRQLHQRQIDKDKLNLLL